MLVETSYLCWGLSSACQYQYTLRKLTRDKLLLLLLVSLHHTFVIHCFTHLCAVSLYISRSSVVHACGRSGQFSKCSIVCGSSVQSHVVSSSQYPHLFILYLHLPTLVLSLLRHCHSHHGNEDPVANDSDGVMFSCVGVDCRWLVHADNLFSEVCMLWAGLSVRSSFWI